MNAPLPEDIRAFCEKYRVTQDPFELSIVRDIIHVLAPRVILEIGVEAGGSLLLWELFSGWGDLLRGAIGVDGQGGERVPEKTMAAYPCLPLWVKGVSQEQATVDEVKRVLGNAKVDFLFIDGGHTFAEVSGDFRSYAPLVRKGGVIGFHDIGQGDVKSFWDSFGTSPPQRVTIAGHMGTGLLFVGQQVMTAWPVKED